MVKLELHTIMAHWAQARGWGQSQPYDGLALSASANVYTAFRISEASTVKWHAGLAFVASTMCDAHATKTARAT